MGTQTLELINPYSKLGLKRRPTYDEIIGLINENETITGKLPDRTATFYKASPEGSFFDGSDALEILKEQQNRIIEREMRDLLMRRNVRTNGGTFNVERMQASSSSSSSSSASFNSPSATSFDADRYTLAAHVQADLAEIDRRMAERGQQTGEEHARQMQFQGSLPLLERFLSGSNQPSSSGRRDAPEEVTQEDNEDEELVADETMQSARSQPKSSKTSGKINYSVNIERMSEKELEFQLFIRGVDMNDPELSLENLRRKGKGKGLTTSQYYRQKAQSMINDGSWTRRVEERLLQIRIREYRDINRPRGSKD